MKKTDFNSGSNLGLYSIKFWQNFEPADLIALVIIVAGTLLTVLGRADSFGPLMLAVVAFYFGMKTPPANPI